MFIFIHSIDVGQIDNIAIYVKMCGHLESTRHSIKANFYLRVLMETNACTSWN